MERNRSFKMPPLDNSQNSRRMRRLEEQKRSRAMKVESARNVDIFAGLSLNSLNDMVIDGENSHAERGKRPSKWANLAMYAEPLELNGAGGVLPQDFATAWIAVAPVPRGKRCILVAYKAWAQGSIVSMRSRAKGNQIMTLRTHLPADTILDCILDEQWETNGIIHVLDILRWKSQDYTQCEASFRFWWRDVKIAELAKANPPASSSSRPPHFSYPCNFQPVPYFSDLHDINLLQNTIIPIARSGITVNVPLAPSDMSDDNVLVHNCQSDGILFYVGESSYEPGPSLLAAWVPVVPFNDGEESPLEVFASMMLRVNHLTVTHEEVLSAAPAIGDSPIEAEYENRRG